MTECTRWSRSTATRRDTRRAARPCCVMARRGADGRLGRVAVEDFGRAAAREPTRISDTGTSIFFDVMPITPAIQLCEVCIYVHEEEWRRRHRRLDRATLTTAARCMTSSFLCVRTNSKQWDRTGTGYTAPLGIGFFLSDVSLAKTMNR
jgi:hypothetical protein